MGTNACVSHQTSNGTSSSLRRIQRRPCPLPLPAVTTGRVVQLRKSLAATNRERLHGSLDSIESRLLDEKVVGRGPRDRRPAASFNCHTREPPQRRDPVYSTSSATTCRPMPLASALHDLGQVRKRREIIPDTEVLRDVRHENRRSCPMALCGSPRCDCRDTAASDP